MIDSRSEGVGHVKLLVLAVPLGGVLMTGNFYKQSTKYEIYRYCIVIVANYVLKQSFNKKYFMFNYILFKLKFICISLLKRAQVAPRAHCVLLFYMGIINYLSSYCNPEACTETNILTRLQFVYKPQNLPELEVH